MPLQALLFAEFASLLLVAPTGSQAPCFATNKYRFAKTYYILLQHINFAARRTNTHLLYPRNIRIICIRWRNARAPTTHTIPTSSPRHDLFPFVLSFGVSFVSCNMAVMMISVRVAATTTPCAATFTRMASARACDSNTIRSNTKPTPRTPERRRYGLFVSKFRDGTRFCCCFFALKICRTRIVSCVIYENYLVVWSFVRAFFIFFWIYVYRELESTSGICLDHIVVGR